MSQIFTIHDKEKCINCKEPLIEMQVGRFTCPCCGANED